MESPEAHDNQLRAVSNGGPIRPPVAEILPFYQLIGGGGSLPVQANLEKKKQGVHTCKKSVI